MKKILTKEDKKWRPLLGAELRDYARASLRAINTGNLSQNWNTTDMARYYMAKGIEAVTGKPIPASVRKMFKRFDKDLDL
jgi:hypothetical protein